MRAQPGDRLVFEQASIDRAARVVRQDALGATAVRASPRATRVQREAVTYRRQR